mgnify:CR=1 FL=1
MTVPDTLARSDQPLVPPGADKPKRQRGGRTPALALLDSFLTPDPTQEVPEIALGRGFPNPLDPPTMTVTVKE